MLAMFNELVKLTPEQVLRKLATIRVTKQRMDMLHKTASGLTLTPDALLMLGLMSATPKVLGGTYGAITAPKGRRMHGAGAAAAQTSGTLGGSLFGAALGGLGGAVLAGSGADNKTFDSAILGGAALGSIPGGMVGNYISRNLYPGPRQLGLGDVEDDKDMPKAADAMSTIKDYGQKALTGAKDFGNQVLEGAKAGNPLYTGGIGAATLGGLSALREMGKEKERRNWANPLLAGAAGAGLGAAVPLGLNAVKELSDNSKFKDPGTDVTKNLDSALVAPREPVSSAIKGLGKQVGPSLGPVGPGLEYAGGVVKPLLGTAIGGTVTGKIRHTNNRLNLLLDGFENVNDAKFNPEVKQHLLEQLGEAGNFQSRTPVQNPSAAVKAVLGQKMMDEVNRARMWRGVFDLNLKQMARHKAYEPLMAHGKVRPGSWLSMIPLGLGMGADAYNLMRGGSNSAPQQ